MKKILLLIAPLALLFFSCKKAENNYIPPMVLNVSHTEINAPFKAFKDTVQIISNANTNWTIKGKPDWITTSTDNGSKYTSVVIFVNANPDKSSRTAQLIVATSYDKDTINISQMGLKTLTVSDTVVTEDFNAFKRTIKVASDGQWTINNSLPDWITLSSKSGSGSSDLVISVKENNSAGDRSVELKLTTSFASKKITITQKGNPALAISKTQINLSYEAAKDTIQIVTGGSWSISNLPDWISVSPQSGTGNATVIISSELNLDLTDRTQQLDVALNGGTKHITVTQSGNSALNTSLPITLKFGSNYINLNHVSDGKHNDYMEVADNTAFNIQPGESFSIAIKFLDFNDNATQATFPHFLSRKSIDSKGHPTGNGYTLVIGRNAQDGLVQFNFTDDNGSDFGSDWSTTNVKDNKWHHAVAVFDQTEGKAYLYIDGVKEGEKTLPTGFSGLNISGPFIVGDSYQDINANWNFGGYVDDVRFYKKALTKKEVYADAANIILPSMTADIVAAWNFENVPSGGPVPDASGNGHNGDLVKGAKIGSF